jgi:hypothetical protein
MNPGTALSTSSLPILPSQYFAARQVVNPAANAFSTDLGSRLIHLFGVHEEFARGCSFATPDLLMLLHAFNQPLKKPFVHRYHSAFILRRTAFSLGVRSSIVPVRQIRIIRICDVP